MLIISTTAATSAAPAPVPKQPPRAYWKSHGCTHGHPSKVAYKRVAQIVRSPKQFTKRRARRAKHYAICVVTAAKSRAVHRHFRKQITWRRSYVGYWRVHAGRLSAAVRATLARLRGCETRGLGMAGYRLDGHHDGSYQYDARTWGEAQSWRGTPGRYRTALAFQASVDHQDVVTAGFFFSHRGRWACSA